MTDQEKKLQRAQLQVELEDAQLELAHRREKGIRLAEGLRGIADKIEMNANLQPSGEDFSMEVELARRLRPEDQALFDYGDAVRLIAELKKFRQDVYNLQNRKSQLARPDGIRIVV